MKIKNVLALFLMCTVLVSAVGSFPVVAHTTVSSLLVKGPQAVLANAKSLANPGYGLFTCQVGKFGDDFVCYDPYQMRVAYGVDKLISAGFDGKGKTIVIIDAFSDEYIVDDLNSFNTFYGLPSLNGLGGTPDPALGTFTQVAPDGLGPYNEGWAGEITLDVEWAHAIAPGANITLVLSKSNMDDDILSATKYAVDHKLGDVISMSFGEDERCVDPALLVKQHNVFAQATMKGITLFASSGDQGAAQPTCDGNSYSLAVSNPASDSLVTGVGGTELHAAGYCLASLGCDPTKAPAPGTYNYEVVWNEFEEMATGGGYSVLYNAPKYQKNTFNTKKRGVPDVAYNGAVYHGVLTYFGGWWLFGGTSAGAPQWAAIAVIADQKAKRDLGSINSALYQIRNSTTNYKAAFHDVKIGNNSVVETDNDDNPVPVDGYSAKNGWDATTGLGSPIVDKLVLLLRTMVKPMDGIAEIANSVPQLLSRISRSGHVSTH